MKIRHAISPLVLLALSQTPAYAVTGDVCSTALPTTARAGLKWYPGHYISMGKDTETGSTLAANFNEIKNDARMQKVVGVLKRYYWSDLQNTSETDLHWTRLRGDINAAATNGKKLTIMLMWKFKTDQGDSPVPQHIQGLAAERLPEYGNVLAKPFYELNAAGASADGQIANLGHPKVAIRLINFLKKLAVEVDGKDAVSGIVFAETAMGMDPSKAPYQPTTAGGADPMTSADYGNIRTAHINGVVRIATQAACIFKKTPIIQLTNFPAPLLPTMRDAYLKFGVGMGGPDVWMNDESILPAYDIYPDVKGKVPVGLIVAGGNYEYYTHDGEERVDRDHNGVINDYDFDLNHDGKNDFLNSTAYGWNKNETIRNLGKKAVNTLNANFVFWKKNGNTGDEYYDAFQEEIDTLRAGGAAPTIPATRTACPTIYGGPTSGNCVTN